jgi:hypothetical protein
LHVPGQHRTSQKDLVHLKAIVNSYLKRSTLGGFGNLKYRSNCVHPVNG